MLYTYSHCRYCFLKWQIAYQFRIKVNHKLMIKLFLIILIVPCLTIAQDCKYDKDEYDKFQKVRKIEKKVKVVRKFNRGNGYLNLLLCKYGELNFFRLSTASLEPITVGSNDATVFLLDNDKTINAYPKSALF